MAYSTQTQIEAILGRVLTAAEITLLAGIQAGADLWIDSQTGVTFGSTPSSRYYDGGLGVLAIDPVRSISAVELVDAELDVLYTYEEGTDYIKGPLNDTVIRYLEKRYYAETYLIDADNEYGRWPSGLKKIKVTGIFSYADSAPDDISYLSAYLTSKMILAKGYLASGTSGPTVKESIEGYSRESAGSSASQSSYAALMDDVITGLLANYQDQEIFF